MQDNFKCSDSFIGTRVIVPNPNAANFKSPRIEGVIVAAYVIIHIIDGDNRDGLYVTIETDDVFIQTHINNCSLIKDNQTIKQIK